MSKFMLIHGIEKGAHGIITKRALFCCVWCASTKRHYFYYVLPFQGLGCVRCLALAQHGPGTALILSSDRKKSRFDSEVSSIRCFYSRPSATTPNSICGKPDNPRPGKSSFLRQMPRHVACKPEPRICFFGRSCIL